MGPQRADAGRRRDKVAGEERDTMGRWELTAAIAQVGRLLSSGQDETQRGSGVFPLLALLTVAMAVFGVLCMFVFVSTLMFLSFWLIVVSMLRA